METVIKADNLSKRYRLGVINTGMLNNDLQSWWARLRGKEDPNAYIGHSTRNTSGYFAALDDVSFEVKRGEALGIIGANGAGKSTLLKLLSRITSPTEGEIRLKGRVTSMLEVGTGFHPEMTGRENIFMNGAILGMPQAEIEQHIEEIIDFSECRTFIDTPVKRYSSGMYVKLAFAVAAHLSSDILIVDEVLAVGDVAFQEKCIRKMESIIREDGRTVLCVSHNMQNIRDLCTRCLVLNKGRIVFDGDVEPAISCYLTNLRGDADTDRPAQEKQQEMQNHIVYHADETDKHMSTIYDFNITGSKSVIYASKEKIRLKLTWQPQQLPCSYRLRFIFFDGTTHAVLGTSESHTFTAQQAGKQHITVFEADISRAFVPGTYYCTADLWYVSPDISAGGHVLLSIEKKTWFSIDDPPGASNPAHALDAPGACNVQNWPTRLYGHTRLTPAAVLESRCGD